MRRDWLIRCGVTLLLVGLPSRSAEGQQAQQVDVVVTGLGNRDANDFRDLRTQAVPIGIRECEGNAVLRVRVNGIPEGQFLSFWRGESGLNCADQQYRQNDNIRGCDPLLISDERANIQGARMVDLNIPIRELLPCTPNLSTEYGIFFLAAPSAEGRGPINGSGVLTIGMDTQPPAAPSNIKPSNGQNQLGVSWEGTEARGLREIWIYTEDNPALCGTTTVVDDPTVLGPGPDLDAGMDDAGTLDAGVDAGLPMDAGPEDAGADPLDAGVPDMMDGAMASPDAGMVTTGAFQPIARGLGPTTRSHTIDPDRVGVEVGQTVAIGVAAVDRAFNVGSIGWVCATRVPTRGFCDRVGGCPDRGCSASAPGEDARGAIVGAAFALFGLALLLRRRRTR